MKSHLFIKLLGFLNSERVGKLKRTPLLSIIIYLSPITNHFESWSKINASTSFCEPVFKYLRETCTIFGHLEFYPSPLTAQQNHSDDNDM
jgi:hypothetical protein